MFNSKLVLLLVFVTEVFSWTLNPMTILQNLLPTHHHNRGKSIATEYQNKKIVKDFYQEVFGDKNIDAIDKYIDEKTYIQHNPHVADGREAFKTAAKEWFEGAPKETIDIQHIGADGDLVWVHLKTMEEGKVMSVMDIFRLQNGKIVEHWDVMQVVPETSMNSHPMF